MRPTIELRRTGSASSTTRIDPAAAHLLLALLNNAADAGEEAGTPAVELHLDVAVDTLTGHIRDHGRGFNESTAILPGTLFKTHKPEGDAGGIERRGHRGVVYVAQNRHRRRRMIGLLVDDDAMFLRALQLVRQTTFDFVLLDLRIGRDSGLKLIAPLKAAQPKVRIVLMTGFASVATAVEAIKLGADDYLLKPVSADTILRALAEDPHPPEDEEKMVPLGRLEWEHIQQALRTTDGNVSAAARLLGMHRRSLQRKLAKRPGPERKDLD